MKKLHLAFVALVALALLMTVGCRRVNLAEEGDSTSESVKLKGAERVEVDVSLGSGDLAIQGGARNLMDGEFEFGDGRLAPEIGYRVSGETGRLDVSQGEPDAWFDFPFRGGAYRNVWDLSFADDVPLQMRLSIGAGGTAVVLGDTMLEEFHLDAGAGSYDIDISGSTSLEDASIQAGAGDVTLDVSGGSILRDIDVDTGVGAIMLDITGNAWRKDVRGKIDSGAGDVRIVLPADVAAGVSVDSGAGDVNAEGLRSRDGMWVNDAWDRGGPEIVIDVDQGVGSVTIEVE